MESFQLLASPWWVNLLILIPFFLFFLYRKNKFNISKRQLLATAIFGIAFGFVEAAVVMYLRAALGMLSPTYESAQVIGNIPKNLLTTEFFREIATIIMLAGIAYLIGKKLKEKFAIFLFAFAFWDIFYYVWLWCLIKWPTSFTTSDVLFLVPVPWISQVWFPCIVSVLSIIIVAICSA